MGDIRIERRVADFAFTVELGDIGNPVCRAAEDRWFALAAALSSVEVEELTRLVEMRAGFCREEAVGFSYAEDSPDEVPAGKVRVFLQEDELFLDRAFFDAAAVEFGLTALDCLRQAGRSFPAGVEARLRAVRRKISP